MVEVVRWTGGSGESYESSKFRVSRVESRREGRKLSQVEVEGAVKSEEIKLAWLGDNRWCDNKMVRLNGIK